MHSVDAQACGKPKPCTLVGFAVDADFAAHALCQTAADHQTEASASVLPGAGTVDLIKGAEQAGLLFVGEAKDRKSTRLNSSHVASSYAVFCLQNHNVIL